MAVQASIYVSLWATGPSLSRAAVPTKEADVDALMRGLTNMVTHDQNSGGLSAKAIAAANAAAAMSSATAKANSKNYVPSDRALKDHLWLYRFFLHSDSFCGQRNLEFPEQKSKVKK